MAEYSTGLRRSYKHSLVRYSAPNRNSSRPRRRVAPVQSWLVHRWLWGMGMESGSPEFTRGFPGLSFMGTGERTLPALVIHSSPLILVPGFRFICSAFAQHILWTGQQHGMEVYGVRKDLVQPNQVFGIAEPLCPPRRQFQGPRPGYRGDWRYRLVQDVCGALAAVDLILSIIQTGFMVDVVFSYIERILQRWLVEMCIARSIFPYSVYEETNFPFP